MHLSNGLHILCGHHGSSTHESAPDRFMFCEQRQWIWTTSFTREQHASRKGQRTVLIRRTRDSAVYQLFRFLRRWFVILKPGNLQVGAGEICLTFPIYFLYSRSWVFAYGHLSLEFTTRNDVLHCCPFSPFLLNFSRRWERRLPYPHVKMVLFGIYSVRELFDL